MKQFSCGDVVAGCAAKFVCSTEEDLMAEVATHARLEHGLTELPDSLVEQVRSSVLTVA